MLDFPQLSRKPALKTRETVLDPTLRDTFENGMESTRARFTRQRRAWDITIDLITPRDKVMLQNFVRLKAVFGANIFNFKDARDPHHPCVYRVRFASLPAYTDAGNVAGEFRQNVTFTLREV